VIRSDSKIEEDWEGKDLEKERERERNKRGTVVQGIRFMLVFFKKKTRCYMYV